MAPRPTSTDDQPGDGGFTAPRVFDTLDEAVLAGTSEDEYLDELDQPAENEQ